MLIALDATSRKRSVFCVQVNGELAMVFVSTVVVSQAVHEIGDGALDLIEERITKASAAFDQVHKSNSPVYVHSH